MKKTLALTVLLGVAALVQAQPLPILGAKDKCLALMPARLLFSGSPGVHTVSPDGRYIAWLVGDAPQADLYRDIAKVIMPNAVAEQPNFHLMVYDRETHTSEDRGALPKPSYPQFVSALGSGGTFLIESFKFDEIKRQASQSYVVLSFPGDRSLDRRLNLADEQDLSIESQNGYWMVSKRTPKSPTQVAVYDATGRLVLQKSVAGRAELMQGGYLFVDGGRRGTRTRLNLTNGRVETVPLRNEYRPDTPLATPFLTWLFKQEQGVDYRPSRLTVRVKGEPAALIMAADIKDFYADPQDRFILYSDGDAILMREMVPVDVADVLRAKREREKKALMDRAKMVGIGMQIYGADYDGILSPGQKWQDRLQPYLRNNDLMQDFVFLLPGVNLSTIDQARTMLGFITGPGGMAVVYADTHVVWVPHK